VPAPGGRRELNEHAQRILSRPLDRTRPLWELYVIEGLDEGHVATLMKVHHAMIDGIAGMQLASTLYDLDPGVPAFPPPRPWTPEPEPSAADLLREAVRTQMTHPVRGLLEGVETAMQAPALTALGLGAVATGVRSILDLGARPASSLDVRVGPNRRFATTEAPVERYKEVKRELGGTVNDVVLTVVAGALHRLLKGRGEATRGRTLRTLVPVSVRGLGDRGSGNRVAPAFVDVPIGSMSAKRRLAEVRKGTQHLKDSMMAMGADAIISLGGYAPGAFLAAAARAAALGPWFNLVVSNIPGPQQPLYLAGARLVASYPAMPLGGNAALSVACTSLAGTMAFGLTADRDAVPDLDALAMAIDESLGELSKAAGL
jgi:WS/DGAT/MGAT family acyltransferase